MARSQHGLVALDQLVAVADPTASRRASREARQPAACASGVFAVAGSPGTFEQVVLAASSPPAPMQLPRIRRLPCCGGCRWSNTRSSRSRLPAGTGRVCKVCERIEPWRSSIASALHIGDPVTTVARTLVDLSGRLSCTARADDRRRLRDGTLRSMTFAMRRRSPPAPGRHPTRIVACSSVAVAGYDPGDSGLEMRFVVRSSARAAGAGSAAPVAIGHRHYGSIWRTQSTSSPSRSTDGSTTAPASCLRRRSGPSERLVVAGWHVLRFTSTMTNEQAVADAVGRCVVTGAERIALVISDQRP